MAKAEKTPRKRTQQELLLGAIALLGAAAALIALGISTPSADQSAAPQKPQATASFTVTSAIGPTANAAQPRNPAQVAPSQTVKWHTSVVVYDSDAQDDPARVPQETTRTQVVSPQPTASFRVTASEAQPVYPVNLNTATQAQLETLPGIGEVKAQAILRWRAAHGGFTSVNQLLEVSGIGEKTLQTLLPYIII